MKKLFKFQTDRKEGLLVNQQNSPKKIFLILASRIFINKKQKIFTDLINDFFKFHQWGTEISRNILQNRLFCMDKNLLLFF